MESTDDEMNNKVSTKKSGGVVDSVKTFYEKNKVIVIILIVILLAAGGFGIYTYMNRDKKNPMRSAKKFVERTMDSAGRTAEKTFGDARTKLDSFKDKLYRGGETGQYNIDRTYDF